MEGGGRCLFKDTIRAFPWRNWRNPRGTVSHDIR